MVYPQVRLRRLRKTSKIRNIVREVALTIDDLIYPVFINEGINAPEPIQSMPGQFRLSMNDIVKEAKNISALRIPAIIIFGIPLKKDDIGTSASDDNGIVQRAVSLIKKELGDELVIITDICLCQYTSHGHCGIVKANEIDNDLSLERLQNIAVSHAKAGTDIVAPSAMMDGQVAAIRKALDGEGFTDVSIMSHSAKHRSSFYSPFRDAAECAPKFGDRKTYQVPFTNAQEAMREVETDINEGVDIVMIKPALSYLDLIAETRRRFNIPLAAYSVSGEYALVKGAASQGWVNEKDIIEEILYSIKRAGANMIVTYFAKSAAKFLQES